MNLKDRILDLFERHPKMSTSDMAERLGTNTRYVTVVLRRAGISVSGKANLKAPYLRRDKQDAENKAWQEYYDTQAKLKRLLTEPAP